MRKLHLLAFLSMGVLGLALIAFGLGLSYPTTGGNIQAMVSTSAPAVVAAELNTRDSLIGYDAGSVLAEVSDRFLLTGPDQVSRDDWMLSEDTTLAMDAGVPPAVPAPSELQNTVASPWEWHRSESRFFVHIVRWGETLSGIAERFDTSVWRLRRLNGICHPNHILAGRRLLIPRED